MLQFHLSAAEAVTDVILFFCAVEKKHSMHVSFLHTFRWKYMKHMLVVAATDCFWFNMLIEKKKMEHHYNHGFDC